MFGGFTVGGGGFTVGGGGFTVGLLHSSLEDEQLLPEILTKDVETQLFPL